MPTFREMVANARDSERDNFASINALWAATRALSEEEFGEMSDFFDYCLGATPDESLDEVLRVLGDRADDEVPAPPHPGI